MAIDIAKLTAMGAVPFFTKYPVTGINAGTAGSAMKQIPDPVHGGVMAPGQDDQNVVTSITRVAHMTIAKVNDPNLNALGGGTRGQNAGGTATITVNAVAGAGSLPVFYLPYSLNYNRRITLVDKQGVGNVRYFLTDCVDGCSIYIEGTPQQPTVSHLNANNVLPVGMDRFPDASDTSAQAAADRVNAWNLKWTAMDWRFQYDGPKPKRVAAHDPALIPSRKLEARDYMLMTDIQRQAFEQTLPNLQHLGIAPATVGPDSVDNMEVVFSQGTVFGFQSVAGIWRFYVQRRVLVTFHHYTFVPDAGPGTLQKAKNKLLGVVGQYRPRYGPLGTMVKTRIGAMWIVRSVSEFWPGQTVGSAAP